MTEKIDQYVFRAGAAQARGEKGRRAGYPRSWSLAAAHGGRDGGEDEPSNQRVGHVDATLAFAEAVKACSGPTIEMVPVKTLPAAG